MLILYELVITSSMQTPDTAYVRGHHGATGPTSDTPTWWSGEVHWTEAKFKRGTFRGWGRKRRRKFQQVRGRADADQKRARREEPAEASYLNSLSLVRFRFAATPVHPRASCKPPHWPFNETQSFLALSTVFQAALPVDKPLTPPTTSSASSALQSHTI